jgi:hypothetical protein
LDAYRGPRRLFEGFRLKEWAGFTLTHPEIYSSMILQDAKYLATSQIYVFERDGGRLTERAGARAGGSIGLPDELAKAKVGLEARGYRLAYNFEPHRIRVMARVRPTDGLDGIRVNLTLDPVHASPPLAVSAPLPGGRGTALYTNKVVYPAWGSVEVGGRVYRFDPARDFAMLDEHKSHLPYRTTWTWGTFAMPVAGGYMGANFASRPQLQGQEEESCLWTPTAAEPLASISFDRLGPGELAPWRVWSADGRLEATFAPEGAKDVRQQFGLASISYWQRFGLYRGVLRGEHRTEEFEGVHGVLEGMRARL